jgi:membrane associated rhomboid family serine protease
MAYYEKQYRRRLSLDQRNNALITLIAIHLILFVILAFVRAVLHLKSPDSAEASKYFDEHVMSWFSLPSDVHKIAARPWTILTHMFVHAGFWHVFGNMLWLWMFGYILQDLTGNRKIFPVFLYGALFGASAFVMAYNFFPALSPGVHGQTALGASAGVMAVAAAATFISPGYRLFPMLYGGIPLWIITALYLLIDLTSIPTDNPGGHIAHLAGALAGFLFMYSYRRGYDWGSWINNFFDWFTNLFNPDKPKKGKLIKSELFYKPGTEPYRKTPNVTEQRIDEILDKISQKGYNSLTDEEKDLLKRASQKDT